MFNKDEYFEKMILNLEDTFGLLYKIGLFSLLSVCILKYIIRPGDLFVVFDVFLLLVMLLMYLFKKRVSISGKAHFISVLLCLTGLLLYLNYGVEGTGFGVLFIANIAAGVFSNKKRFRIIFLLTIGGVVLITAYRELVVGNVSTPFNTYVFQIVLLFLGMYVLRVAVYALRNSLLENIVELDNKLEENKVILHEIKQQNIEIKTNEEEIFQLAYFDQLTNLPMKNLFKSSIEKEIENKQFGTLILIDIKDFKLLNSVYGSQIGDSLLKIAGEVMLEMDAPLLHACRISGNDFGLWYNCLDVEKINVSLKEMLLNFNVRARKIFMYNKVKFYMAYSQFPNDASTYIEMYNKSVVALNYSKVSKDTTLIKFTKEMEKALQEENHLKELIEDAIQRRAFEVHYQEKYDSVANKVIGVEALARWHSEDLGHVTPGEFIPIITKYQLTGSFERLIIGKVFSDYAEIIKKYGDISIGINISPEHIILPQFIKYFEDAILLYKVNPSLITLEITEEVMINGMDHVRDILNRLKQLGLKISLDDFGSGYSSLNYLAKIPFDEIKIDKSFVDEIEEVRVQTILKAIIEIKDSYNIQLIAEGVETSKQLEILQELGCTLIQGYLFSKPKPLNELQL